MVWLNGWGLLLGGVMLGGIGLPLLLHWRRPSGDSRWWIGPALVLLGGLTLRVVVVFSADGLGRTAGGGPAAVSAWPGPPAVAPAPTPPGLVREGREST